MNGIHKTTIGSIFVNGYSNKFLGFKTTRRTVNVLMSTSRTSTPIYILPPSQVAISIPIRVTTATGTDIPELPVTTIRISTENVRGIPTITNDLAEYCPNFDLVRTPSEDMRRSNLFDSTIVNSLIHRDIKHDRIVAFGGDDLICGDRGDDLINGGLGDNTLTGSTQSVYFDYGECAIDRGMDFDESNVVDWICVEINSDATLAITPTLNNTDVPTTTTIKGSLKGGVIQELKEVYHE